MSSPGARQKRWFLAVLSVGAAWLLLALSAIGVSAHAALVSTNPTEGEILPSAPSEITITFNESVQPIDGAFRLFDGLQTETPLSARASGHDVVVTTPTEMADGSWALAWRVVSADGHPISGVLTFAIGAPSGQIDVGSVNQDNDQTLVISIVQGIGYVSLLAASGLVLFQRFVGATHVDRSAGKGLASVLGGVGILAWLALVPLGILRQRGEPIGKIWDWRAWGEHLDGAMLTTSLLVIGGLLLATIVAPLLSRSNGDPLAIVGVAIALVGPTVSGHTRVFTPIWAMVVSNLIHTVVAAVWLGGLLGLVLFLRSASRQNVSVEDRGHVIARFSTLAGVAVALLIPSGLLSAWLVLEGLQPFIDTTWGRLVLLKLGLVLVVVALAAWNRFRLVPAITSHRVESGGPTRALARIAALECTILVVVALVTGGLVNQSPASATLPDGVVPTDHHAALDISITLGTAELTGTLEPMHPGTNTLSFQLVDVDGNPLAPREAPTIQASLPDRDLGPLTAESFATGDPGSYTVEIPLPLAGEWELTVLVRISTFEEARGTVTVTIPERATGH